MAKIKPMYCYAGQPYEVEDTIPPGDDSYLSRLTEHQKKVEQAIRARSPEVAAIRDCCVFTYDNEDLAKRGRSGLQKQLREEGNDLTLHLYELEIDTADILFVADLNHFTTGVEAAKNGEPIDDAVTKYLSGMRAGEPYIKPRWEFLVSKALVIGKL
jgi:hypothetical protein